ncbi:MAG: short-chain dehydrogenase/reductase [Caulobacteraceae bacterium]|nr:short-chain dehydrogenase/reductase [Caulobacteraceae bacterium]
MTSNSQPLSGKAAVVLGGSGGIGAASAMLLAAAGARVAVVASRDPGKADVIRRTLSGSGHGAYAAAVEDSASLARLAEAIKADFGGADILVNSAGMTRPVPHGDLDALTDELFDQVMTVNCRGAFAAVRAFAPQLQARGQGLVVNISSIASTTAVGSSIAYCASKAGMDVMGAALARALAPAIRVMTVSPGVVDTDFVPGRDRSWSEKQASATPLRRLTSPHDVAQAVLACAPSLAFTTGSVVQVDGGRHL